MVIAPCSAEKSLDQQNQLDGELCRSLPRVPLHFQFFTASPLTFRALLVSNQSRLTYLSSRHIFCVLAVSVLQQSEVHSLLIAMISASRANGCRISALGTVSVLQAWLAHVVHTHLHSQASTVPKFFDPDTVNLQQSFPWPKTQRSTMLILCLYLTPN